MAYLPLANLLHHKLRSVLSALGIGIGICMLVTLTGLSRGSLFEIAERLEAVSADLIVTPRGWGDDTADKSGSALPDVFADRLRKEHGDLVERAVPVFVWPMKLLGQDHRATGIDAADWSVLAGGKKLLAGRLFDPNGQFADWIVANTQGPPPGKAPAPEATSAAATQAIFDPTEADLANPAHDGLELVIDQRLARAGHFTVGQKVYSAGHNWRIVGIAPTGVMTRIFLPRRTAQFLFGVGDTRRGTMIFVKLRPGVAVGSAAAKIHRAIGHDVMPLDRYRGMLVEKFGLLFVYVDAVNVVALVIAFLFIMITLYTMVLQRTREIAILKSCGASNWFILRQVLAESMLLTGFGTGVGIGLSFLAGAAIEAFKPLLTVTITWHWVVVAVLAAAAGSIISGLYPALRAVRVDVLEALTLE